MRAASRALVVLAGLAMASACHQGRSDGNVAIEANETGEIEALPPDESAATPTNELQMGDDEAANVDQPANSD